MLLGYSQGAYVIGDALDPVGAQLPADVTGRISAIALFGDPTFRGGEPFNRGTRDSYQSGVFARAPGRLAPYADRLGSWCDRFDNFCQLGDVGAGHFGYGVYRGDVTAFVATRYGQ